MKMKLLAAATLVAASGAAVATQVETATPTARADVMITVGKGFGSGVHIGNGYILTANHVVDQKDVELKVKLQDNEIRPLEVLWGNKEYDIALTRTSNYVGLGVASLDCRDPQVSEPIISYGNPMGVSYTAFHGYVAGEPRQTTVHKRVTPVDSSTIWGMSGGPVMDAAGSVIGISVATEIKATSPISSTWVRIGWIVPAKTICQLMGKTE